jgi:hypothetical protein
MLTFVYTKHFVYKPKTETMLKLLFASALTSLLSMASFAQNHKENTETIEGNGKLVTREVPVNSFDALKASGVYELKLSQGSKEAVKIEADENLQDLFQVRNEGSKLIIDMKKLEHKNLKIHDKIRIYVTFKNLKSMEFSTVGNVNSEEALTFSDLELENHSVGHVDLKLNANKVEIKNTSVGNVKLSGKADNAVVTNSGVGSIQAGNFVVQTMSIENTGVGNAEVNAEKNIKVKDSFLGKVRNKGAAHIRRMNKVVI